VLVYTACTTVVSIYFHATVRFNQPVQRVLQARKGHPTTAIRIGFLASIMLSIFVSVGNLLSMLAYDYLGNDTESVVST
jgi:hypothetical protein